MYKVLILILTVLLTSFSSFGQENATTLEKVMLRVDCQEKQNHMVRALPKLLLEEFRLGNIKAYFPTDLSKQMSYEDFLAHFGFPTPEVKLEASSGDCGKVSPKIDPWDMRCFMGSFELSETRWFDKNASRQKRKVEYLQMIYSYECSMTGLDYYGPAFKYQDMIKVQQSIVNPKNDAVMYSTKQVFDLQLYGISMIKKGNNDYYENPAVEGEEEKHKGVNKEIENWSH